MRVSNQAAFSGMRAVTPLFLALIPAILLAEHPSTWCATSKATNSRLEQLMLSSKDAESRVSAAPTVRLVGDTLVLSPDDTLTPMHHPVDLENSTIVFTPATPSTFTVERTALQYLDDTGERFATFSGSGDLFKNYRLTNFGFPFGDRVLRDLSISERFGIFLSPPHRLEYAAQLSLVDVAIQQEAIISPLLTARMYRASLYAPREIFVRETAEELVVTWRMNADAEPAYSGPSLDVQAVLRANGSILFSYRMIRDISWGAVIVTTGDELARMPVTLIGAADDAQGDTTGANTYGLDIRRVEIERVGNSELMQIRMRFSGPVPPSAIQHDIVIQFVHGKDRAEFSVHKPPLGWRYFCLPLQGCFFTTATNPSYANNAVLLTITDRLVPFTGTVDVRVTSNVAGSVDTAALQIQLTHGSPADADFSEFDSPRELPLPLFEAFTVPPVNLAEVWRRIRRELALSDDDVDAVAVFQNFQTDIVFMADAYAFTGNGGADGVWANRSGTYGSALPKAPTLIHMNQLRAERNDADAIRARTLILAHEFGHRWLYNFDPRLNIDEGHPGGWVHLPAAYPLTEFDSSVMGGGFFTDLGGGRFRAAPVTSPTGYSSHELYLMGLVTPSEVEPWFYLAGAMPPLEDFDFPPGGMTVSANRVNLTADDIIRSVGPRVPAVEESQKTFRLLFVLLQEPSGLHTQEEVLLAKLAEAFRHYFVAATGGRGTIVTTLPLAHPRRRAIRR